jgi:hypothetical protein
MIKIKAEQLSCDIPPDRTSIDGLPIVGQLPYSLHLCPVVIHFFQSVSVFILLIFCNDLLYVQFAMYGGGFWWSPIPFF